MKLSGSYKLNVKKEHVWKALNDPNVLIQCIPGCESFNKECSDYMKTGEYKQRLFYAHFMRGIFNRDLLSFKKSATTLLDRVMESDYK